MTGNEPFERRVGTRLQNKWTLERLLGVGGMAAVYEGVHTIGRRVAIKILHPEVAADAGVRGRFEQEARAVNSFRHPGAVEIVDFDVTDDGQPFLVMELLEGHSLQELLDQGHVPSFDRLMQLTDELLDVLAAAHAHGIIHRDIKPDNLFVLASGALKVLDFGIARVRTDDTSGRKPTQTGTTIGTVVFMPPEQVVGSSDIDARADIFAVGATMFRVLTGRYVHDAEGQFQRMVQAASSAAPPLASVLPAVPAEVALVVDRALAFDRDNRYPDARTMQDDVRALLRRQAPPYASLLARSGGPPVSYKPTREFAQPAAHIEAPPLSAAMFPAPGASREPTSMSHAATAPGSAAAAALPGA
ncbi:MAG: serine/threonine protein kinase, partial [Myxococcales bacterium]